MHSFTQKLQVVLYVETNFTFSFWRPPIDAPQCTRQVRSNMAAPFASGTGRGVQSPNRQYNTYAYFCRNPRLRE